MPIYAVSVTYGKEELVAEMLAYEAKRGKYEIYSVMAIPQLKGFIFVEAENSLDVQRAILGIKHAKKVLPEEVNIEELLKYFEEEKVELKVGDIVEIIIGALKGSKGKVIKVDDKKNEVTIELLDVPVPLNVTLPINNVKVIEKS